MCTGWGEQEECLTHTHLLDSPNDESLPHISSPSMQLPCIRKSKRVVFGHAHMCPAYAAQQQVIVTVGYHRVLCTLLYRFLPAVERAHRFYDQDQAAHNLHGPMRTILHSLSRLLCVTHCMQHCSRDTVEAQSPMNPLSKVRINLAGQKCTRKGMLLSWV